MSWLLPAILGTLGAIGGTLMTPGAGTAAGAEAGAAAGGAAGAAGGAAAGLGAGTAAGAAGGTGAGLMGTGMGTAAGMGGGLLGSGIAGSGALFGTTAGLGGAGMGTAAASGLGAAGGALAGAGPAAFGGSSLAYPFTMPAAGSSFNPQMALQAMRFMQASQQQPQQGAVAQPMPVTGGRQQNPQLQQQLQMAQGQMPAYSQFRPFGFTG